MILTYNNIITHFKNNESHTLIINTISKCKEYIIEFKKTHHLSYSDIMEFSSTILIVDYIESDHMNIRYVSSIYHTIKHELNLLERYMKTHYNYDFLKDAKRFMNIPDSYHYIGKCFIYHIIREHMSEIHTPLLSFKQYIKYHDTNI